MTVEELIADLQRRIANGSLNPDDAVQMRDPEVSYDAMQAGSNGWTDLEEVLPSGDGRALLKHAE
jgi:hypothetical protein